MPYDERDEESGQFVPTFTDEEFVTAAEGGATTSDVAERVGCDYQTAYSRLTELRDRGRVSSRDVGGSLLWTTSDERDSN